MFCELHWTFRLVQNDRDVSFFAGTLCFRDDSSRGPGSQNIRTGTHRLGTSRHPAIHYMQLNIPGTYIHLDNIISEKKINKDGLLLSKKKLLVKVLKYHKTFPS